MTIEEVQARLSAAQARLGREGRFALTLSLNGREECYITHWFRPDPHAFEDCRAVGSGTVSECLAALDRYVAVNAPASGADSRARNEAPVLMAAE
ncbi:hypothetical protein [Azospirillum sp. TSO35-2]|uniref:hypothetical protein n=1 Tax=Azospirillum sp. TSO35-2 TaxID=716796 RepID=UPI000D603416|nr:hypothetical protein [Azospirillum sp. TSO35-2]PWC39229.1 hypothetical protein TSO352_03225 [Azospirillum sp. TSO35-2]